MNKKILLPVFLTVMTTTAAEVAPKTMPAKVVEQQQEESVFTETSEYSETYSFKTPTQAECRCRAKDNHLNQEKH